MDIEILWFIVKIMIFFIPPGFFAGLIFMGLMWLYNSFSAWVRLPLKIITITPLIILLVAGLNASRDFLPHVIVAYVLLGVMAESGRRLYFKSGDESNLKKTAGIGLLAAAAYPFICAGFLIVAPVMGSQTYGFEIHNLTGHEIVIKEAKAGNRLLLVGEKTLRGNQEPVPSLSDEQEYKLHLAADFWLKPGKIIILSYDASLGREFLTEIDLPNRARHPFCPIYIVYDQHGFHYDDRICD